LLGCHCSLKRGFGIRLFRAEKADVEGAELHRFRKTYADTMHEEGVSVNTIRIRLGHESLDVTLAYLKGKDAESEEAQEHANSSSLALYAQKLRTSSREISG
jgi:integrase